VLVAFSGNEINDHRMGEALHPQGNSWEVNVLVIRCYVYYQGHWYDFVLNVLDQQRMKVIIHDQFRQMSWWTTACIWSASYHV